MTTLKELNAYLEQPFQIDQWWEYGIDRARDILERLSDSDWDAMRNNYRSSSEESQLRLAQAIFSVSSNRGVPLLLDMVFGATPAVAYEAICSLNALSADAFPVQVPMEAALRIQQLQQQLPSTSHPILEEVLVRLSSARR